MKTAQVRDPVHIGKVVRNALVFKFREPKGGIVNDSGPKPAETKTAFDDYTKGITSGRQKDFEFEAEAMADRFRGECSTLLSRIKDDPDQAERAARDLVLSQTRLIALPLAVVHVDESSLLPSVKSLIEDIYNTTETTAGYPSIIGVPHVLSGFIYMACSVMALKARSWRALKFLLSTKFEWRYQSAKQLYAYGFDHPYLFHSHAFERRADKIHDFFREVIGGQLQPVFGLDEEKLINRYIQTQMLMCLRGAQLLEQGEDIAMYADFGRFFAWRAEELLEQMRSDSDFAEGVSAAFGETPSQFLDRLQSRLKLIRSEMWRGGSYIWHSIKGWPPEEQVRHLA